MERLHYIDVAKGILILLLIISHLGIVLKWNNFDSSYYFSPVFFFVPCFSVFFMQCFFFMTGFCSSFNIHRSLFFVKLFKQLVVPTLFYGILQGLVFRFASDYINVGYKGGFYTQFWFLNSVIFAKTFVYLSHKFLKNIYAVFAVSFIALLLGVALNQYDIGYNVLYIRHGLIACFFVALGYVAQNKLEVLKGIWHFLWILFPSIMILCYLKGWVYSLPSQDANINVDVANIPLFIIITVAGICFFLKTCKMIYGNKCIEYLGKNSLIIYCLHIVPLSLIVRFLLLLFQPYNIFTGVLFLILTLVLELGIMLLLIMILNRKPLSYFSGKWR